MADNVSGTRHVKMNYIKPLFVRISLFDTKELNTE